MITDFEKKALMSAFASPMPVPDEKIGSPTKHVEAAARARAQAFARAAITAARRRQRIPNDRRGGRKPWR